MAWFRGEGRAASSHTRYIHGIYGICSILVPTYFCATAKLVCDVYGVLFITITHYTAMRMEGVTAERTFGSAPTDVLQLRYLLKYCAGGHNFHLFIFKPCEHRLFRRVALRPTPIFGCPPSRKGLCRLRPQSACHPMLHDGTWAHGTGTPKRVWQEWRLLHSEGRAKKRAATKNSTAHTVQLQKTVQHTQCENVNPARAQTH